MRGRRGGADRKKTKNRNGGEGRREDEKLIYAASDFSESRFAVVLPVFLFFYSFMSTLTTSPCLRQALPGRLTLSSFRSGTCNPLPPSPSRAT